MSSYSNRAPHDQYFTPQWLASHVAKTARQYACCDDGSTFIEPAAGRGDIMWALFKVMTTKDALMAVELDSVLARESGSMQADFLQWKPPLRETHKNVVVGNPPFRVPGIGNAVVAFINHASRFAHTVVFVVPASMHRPATQNRVDRKMHIVQEESFGNVEFTCSDKQKKFVHVYLQVWQRKSELRPLYKFAEESEHFTLPYRSMDVLRNDVRSETFPWPDIIVTRNGSHHQVEVRCTTKAKRIEDRVKERFNARTHGLHDFFIYLKAGVSIGEFLERIELRRKDMYQFVKSVHTLRTSYDLAPQEFIRLYDHGLEKMWTNL